MVDQIKRARDGHAEQLRVGHVVNTTADSVAVRECAVDVRDIVGRGVVSCEDKLRRDRLDLFDEIGGPCQYTVLRR